MEETAAYRTAVGDVISPGNPDRSEVVTRASRRDSSWPSMPPLGTEVVDEVGLASLRAFIDALK